MKGRGEDLRVERQGAEVLKHGEDVVARDLEEFGSSTIGVECSLELLT